MTCTVSQQSTWNIQAQCDDTVVSRHSKESENSRCKISQSAYVQSQQQPETFGHVWQRFRHLEISFRMRWNTFEHTFFEALNIQDVEVYIDRLCVVLHVFSCCFVGLLNPLRCVWQQQQTVSCSNMPTIIIFTMIYSSAHTRTRPAERWLILYIAVSDTNTKCVHIHEHVSIKSVV